MTGSKCVLGEVCDEVEETRVHIKADGTSQREN